MRGRVRRRGNDSEHHARLREALEPHALQRWPYPGTIALRESTLTGERVDMHVFRDWCWLGTARDEGALQPLLDSSPRGQFDLDVYRLLAKRLGGRDRPAVVRLE